jgi:hypothetical protein
MSANKNTPTKGSYDLSKSPNNHKKRKPNVQMSVVTQTEYIIPVTTQDIREPSISDMTPDHYRPSFGT